MSWFNESQNEVVSGLVRAGIAHMYFESIHPFEDGNGRRYMVITGASKATATRDLHSLVKSVVFVSVGAGRGARYELQIV